MEKKLNILLIGLSIFSIYESIKISGNQLTSSSPGSFPLFISILLFIFSSWTFIEANTNKRKQGKDEIFTKEIIVFIILLVVYALTLELIGFEIATFGFLVITISYLSKGKIVRNILVSLLSVAFITLIFKTIFKVMIP